MLSCHIPSLPNRLSLAIIGAGAFGQFCIPHLLPFFTISLCDPRPDLEAVCEAHDIRAVDSAEAAKHNVVLLAIPFRHLRSVAKAIAPHLNPGALVVDVCSVKVKPLEVLKEELVPTVDIVGTHPLFGPQSGRNGIEGLRIALCPLRSRRSPLLEHFLRQKLKLDVMRTSAEHHDRQMAYVQGLTHLISRIVVAMDVPPVQHRTATFSHLESMVGMERQDSDELFHSIVADNPFTGDMLQSFAKAAQDVLQPFSYPVTGNAP